MAEVFDRVAIADSKDSTEYIVLESVLVIDYGHGQGPKGGALTLKDGKVTVQGGGEAVLHGGIEEQGGTFPPRLKLTDSEGELLVDVVAHADPIKSALAQVRLEGRSSTLTMRDEDLKEHVLLDGVQGNLWLGGEEADGDVVLYRKGETENRDTARATIHLNGATAKMRMRDTTGNEHVLLDGGEDGGNLWLGGVEADGDLFLFQKGETKNRQTDRATIHLNGGAPDLTMRDSEGNEHVLVEGGNLWLGGKKADGDVLLFREGEKDNRSTENAHVHLNGEDGQIRLRARDDGTAKDRIFLDASLGNLWLGGNGKAGDLMIFDDGARTENSEEARIVMNGGSGDIVLRNADCAEDFDAATEGATPGTLMVIGADGELEPCATPYDKKVAGVVSGAGDFRPGIVLDRQPSLRPRLPIALLGKVFCLVDADVDPIEIGDLLTTSATPGHAMRAADPMRAFGAVIGKALRPLARGRGLVPILVCLQ